MASAGDRLVTARAVYRRRSDGRTTGDIAFAFYAGALITGTAGVPAIGALARVLAHPLVLNMLQAPVAGRVVGVLCGVVLAVFAAVGAVRGPALLSPFLLAVLAGNDLPRSRTLVRPFVAATMVLSAVMTGVAVLVAGVLFLTGVATLASCVWFALAAVAFGVLCSVVCLTGQRLTAPRSWLLSTAILVATLLTWAAPSLAVLFPWGWMGLSWPPGPPLSWRTPVLLVITTLAAGGLAPRLLNGLSGPVLLEQAHRWQSAEVATGTADFAGALATYRPKPRLGRSWRAVTSARVLPRFFTRDLVGALRTPGRFLTGTVFLVLGGFIAALGTAPTNTPTWIPTAVGAGLSYAALGVFTDGFRHAADTAPAAPLYGYSTARLYALHALLPTAWAIASAIIGASFATLAGASSGSPISAGLLAIFLVAVRAYDSAKGRLPLSLQTPVSTPAGDLSGLLVLAWQADALLIATITAVAVTPVAGSTLTATVFFAVATVTMLAATRQRLRNL